MEALWGDAQAEIRMDGWGWVKGWDAEIRVNESSVGKGGSGNKDE